jgi:hypothetical protein
MSSFSGIARCPQLIVLIPSLNQLLILTIFAEPLFGKWFENQDLGMSMLAAMGVSLLGLHSSQSKEINVYVLLFPVGS